MMESRGRFERYLVYRHKKMYLPNSAKQTRYTNIILCHDSIYTFHISCSEYGNDLNTILDENDISVSKL